jgi:hypothetical protein
MFSTLIVHGLQYADYALEASLVVVLLLRGWWKRYPGFFAYLSAFALIDAILRPTVLYSYGQSSRQYLYGYYLTDIILTLGAFLLICLFFRRACAQKREFWPVLRTMLISVFSIVTFLSCFTMSRHYGHLAMSFAVQLSQNVYFACLVLNTLLYIMMQYVDCADENLKLLVCGLGIEFAGSAAAMALAALMPTWSSHVIFASFVIQFCTIGMCSTWLYAATRKPEPAPVRTLPTSYRPIHAFAHAQVQGTH